MRTSEQVERVVEGIRGPLADIRRFQVNLPAGATLEVAESTQLYLEKAIELLEGEAAILRKWHD